MKKIALIIMIFVSLTSFIKSGKMIYKPIEGKSYHPIIAGQNNTYKTNSDPYKMYLDLDTTTFLGRKYIKQTFDYGNSQSFAYYREENGNVIYINADQKKETIEIPAKLEKGMVWYEGDSTWRYTLIGTNELLETPESIFQNCIVIEAENITSKLYQDHKRLYHQHFQRGRGYVGTKLSGQVVSYLSIR
jgi:hypothetical protein